MYLSIRLETPVSSLGPCLVFGQKLISGWVAIRISRCALEEDWLRGDLNFGVESMIRYKIVIFNCHQCYIPD